MSSNAGHYCHYVEKICTMVEPSGSSQGLFFAYPASPETAADAIRGAIKMIRADRTLNLPAVDWTELPIEGNLILCEICKAIRKVSCVVVNTTYVNFNVLFEYGFAIGTGKAIWPLVEEGVSKDELVSSNIKSVTTIGYSQFSNSNSIFKKIIKKQPWERASQFSLPEPLADTPTREATGIFYVKSTQNNEPSLRISELLFPLPVEVIIDDPIEVPFRHVAWYLNQLGKAYATIIHLGSERMVGAKLHWAKCALVAGMALALGRRLLIIGENISLEPIDYRDLLRTYKNANEAETITKAFLDKAMPDIARYRQYMARDIVLPGPEKRNIVTSADLGDYVAENELIGLHSYFVETPEFNSALEPKCKVFVGRKGTGKTANFYMLARCLGQDKRNTVCMIKPKEYELNDLLQFVKNELDLAKKGYLLESLWKYMLYSEALVAVRNRLLETPYEVALFEPKVKRILDQFERTGINPAQSFTGRLVLTVRSLCKISTNTPDLEVAVSEILHTAQINRMHQTLCEYIESFNIGHFAVLIDGLDANWRMGDNHEIMADILLALMGAARDAWRSLSKDIHDPADEKGVLVAMFFRSDVFRATLERARDPDKLQYESLNWPDVDSLVNLVVKRIMVNAGSGEDEVLNWTEILDPGFDYDDMKTFLTNNVLLRPRDFIYYFQRVMYHTRLKGTKYITRRDFQSALNEYSQWVLLSLSAEAQPYIPNMLDLLLAFDQKKAVLSVEEIDGVLADAGVAEKDFRRALNFLVDINFLGYGIDNNNYRFPFSPAEEAIMLRRFLRHTRGNYTLGKFKIHNAFHPVLTIQ